MNRMKDKIVLVFGAGSVGPGWGNGKAAAVAYAREGGRVVCVDINLEAAQNTLDVIRSEGGDGLALAADVTKADEIAAAVDKTVDLYGRVDVLHNNVGINLPGALNLTQEQIDFVCHGLRSILDPAQAAPSANGAAA